VRQRDVKRKGRPPIVVKMDAEALLGSARRPLVLGIGGGGDVVGALGTAEASRLYAGADPVVGGVAWERKPIDPKPGPRPAAEIADAETIAPGVLLARAGTRVRESGVLFAESRMAEFLGEPTVLVDVRPGPRAVAEGLARAVEQLGCDLTVFLDVGGDALAHGHEPGLGSPLCDAVMLAAAVRLEEAGHPVLGAVFGAGCDGELTIAELSERLADIAAAGGIAGARGLTPPIVERLEAAVERIPTEASAQALLAFRGAHGPTSIRNGRRTLELGPAAAGTVYFDVPVAVRATARLAAAVMDAADLDDANAILNGLGVSTELDWEIAAAAEA
jgi:hypothetical protein